LSALLVEDTTWGAPPADRAGTWSLTGSLGVVSEPSHLEWACPPIRLPQSRMPRFMDKDSSVGRCLIFTSGSFLDAPTQPPQSIAELRDLSGLTAGQIGRLFGVSRRSINHWLAGKVMSPVHEERLSQILLVVRGLDGSTPDQRRARLLDSSTGVSLFHRFVAQVTPPERLQVSPINSSDRF
jgi:DNA-binding transcriptional regulator YiaG